MLQFFGNLIKDKYTANIQRPTNSFYKEFLDLFKFEKTSLFCIENEKNCH